MKVRSWKLWASQLDGRWIKLCWEPNVEGYQQKRLLKM